MFWLRLDVFSKPKSLVVLNCILGGHSESVKWVVDSFDVGEFGCASRTQNFKWCGLGLWVKSGLETQIGGS